MTHKYSEGAQKEVKKEMHDYKEGKAHSGTGGHKVSSREQAIAIGLSKARKKGRKCLKSRIEVRLSKFHQIEFVVDYYFQCLLQGALHLIAVTD